MRILSAAAAISLVVAAIVMGTDFSTFVNAPSLLIVLGLTACVPVAHHSPLEVFEALRAGFCSRDITPEDSERHMSILSTVRMAAVGSGVLGLLIGLVQMLAHLDDPRQIGPSMAVALLTVLYGVVLSELVVGPLINRLRVKAAPSQNTMPPASASAVLNMSAILGSLIAFLILVSSLQ